MNTKVKVILGVALLALVILFIGTYNSTVLYASGESSSTHGKGDTVDYNDTYHWYKCKCGCSKKYKKDGTEVTYGVAHSFSTDTEPTCTEDGSESCSCGATRAIAKLGHNHSSSYSDVSGSPGYRGRKCSRCDDYADKHKCEDYKVGTYVDDTKHKVTCGYANGKCGMTPYEENHKFSTETTRVHHCDGCKSDMKKEQYQHAFNLYATGPSSSKCISPYCDAEVSISVDGWVEAGPHYPDYMVFDSSPEWTEANLPDSLSVSWNYELHDNTDKDEASKLDVFVVAEGEKYTRVDADKASNINKKITEDDLMTAVKNLQDRAATLPEDGNVWDYMKSYSDLYFSMVNLYTIVPQMKAEIDTQGYADLSKYFELPDIITGTLGNNIFIQLSWQLFSDATPYAAEGDSTSASMGSVIDLSDFAGRFRIQRVAVKIGQRGQEGKPEYLSQTYTDGGRLFFRDDPPPPPKDYYGYFTVRYRDTNGKIISGAPFDKTSRKIIYHGPDGYITANFSGRVDLDTMDPLGYRYVGYKVGTTQADGTDEFADSLTKSESYSVNLSMAKGQMMKVLTFYFEPVKVTVKHINKNREEIPTNKSSVSYLLPKMNDSAGHSCDTLGCELDTMSGFPTKAFRFDHYNTSLNKYLWPGYILTDYKITSDNDGSVIGSKAYKTDVTATPTNYDGITTHALSGYEMAQLGILDASIPVEVYRKNIKISSNYEVNENDRKYSLSHTKGYMPDITITFNYENVDIGVEHRAVENNTILKSTDGTSDLAYRQTLNGHYFELPSLFTQGTHTLSINGSTLPSTGLPYDISGRIIKKLELYKGSELIWEKEFSYKQKEGESLEAVSADNLLYYVLSSNDKDLPAKVKSEINRIGNDIKFIYYYEKVPTLTIRHVDEAGLKLWPDEHVIIAESGARAKSKDLTKHNYSFKEYTLDGTLAHSEVRDSSNNNIVYVDVPRNGLNDRELVFIYREDYPILKVKFVDESGASVAEDLPDIKMTGDSHNASALDLSGLSYEYLRFELYNGITTASGIDKDGTGVTVEVARNGQSRLLLFIYKQKDGHTDGIDVTEINSEAIILRANDRGASEEYNALRAVPTSEDLYANVITDSFLLSNAITQEEKTAKIKVKLIQPYYKRNDADSSSTGKANETDKAFTIESSKYLEIDMPYSYIAAKNVQLDIISRAVIWNESIEGRDDNGNIKVDALGPEKGHITISEIKYKKFPSLDYTAGGKLIFHDLAIEHNLNGKTVSEYVAGLPSGKYDLSTGFYNVKVKELPNHEFEYEVEYVLPEVQYTTVTREMMDDIELKYSASPSLLSDACEKNDVRVNMDRLYVNDASLNNDGTYRNVMILSGLDLPINREYTAIQLDKMRYGREPNPDQLMADLHPKASLVDKDVVYRPDQIYVSKDKINKDYNTSGDVYYKAHERVNPDTLEVEPATDHTVFLAAETFEVADPDYWKNNGEILVNAKKGIVGNKVFVHTPVVNSTMIIQPNNVVDHINKIFIGKSNTTKVNNNNTNNFVAFTYKDIYNKADDINNNLTNLLRGRVTGATVSKVVDIEQKNANKANTTIQNQTWNGGVSPVSEDVPRTTNDVTVTLLLGSSFDIYIPHKGTHLDETGYGRNTYNFGGLNANGDGFNKTGRYEKNDYAEPTNNPDYTFAWKKQIKFSFDVIDSEGNVLNKNEWHDLSLKDELYNFRLLEENMELWQNNRAHTIDTRVIAENAKGTKITDMNAKGEYDNISQNFANLDRDNYIAYNHFDVNIISDIRDLEVRATTDIDWANITGNPNDIKESIEKLPVGQAKQNKNMAYSKAIKIGDAVYFDIATNGWFGDTVDSINIKPKYYFIGRNGGQAKEVDIYYKQTQNGPYVNVANSTTAYKLSTVMAADTVKGSEFKSSILFNKLLAFGNTATKEMDLTNSIRQNVVNEAYKKWVNTYRGGLANNSLRIDLGDTSNIKLPYNTRLAYLNNVELLFGTTDDSKYKVRDVATSTLGLDGIDYSVGHWYGAFELPSSSIAVDKGVTPDPTGSNRLTDGYIIVGFSEITTTSNNKDYLKYEPTKLKFQLPDGGEGELPPNILIPPTPTPSDPTPDDPSPSIPVVIYELIPNTVKFGPTMTH